MAWRVRFRPSAIRELAKLPLEVQRRVLDYLERTGKDPRAQGRAMKVGRREKHLWRYRVGRYRVVCHLRDEDATVLVLRVGHRREIYRRLE